MRPDSESEYADYLRARLPRLHRAAYLLCGDAHRAEDIVQATALALYLRWDWIRAVDNVDGYVHRMLVRQFLGQRRLAWARVLLTDRLPDRAAPAQSSVEDRDAVTRALAQLPPGQRAVVVLRYWCDLSIEATSAAMNCSTGNVKSQATRGLATLRRLLTGSADPVSSRTEGASRER
jgi:RNA polymerase sigma-70 factor (sigma-E family)